MEVFPRFPIFPLEMTARIQPTWCSEDRIQRSVSGRPCSEPSVLKSAAASASRSLWIGFKPK